MTFKQAMIEAAQNRLPTVIDRFYVKGSDGHMMLSFAPAGTEVTRAKSDEVSVVTEDRFVIGWEQYPDHNSGYSRAIFPATEIDEALAAWERKQEEYA